MGLKSYLTIDEWTSSANRKYLNVNVHFSCGTFYCIGLIRIKGPATAEALLDMIEYKLKEYGVDLRTHVISITSDGASVMKKLKRDSQVIYEMCINHALHLAVIDFFKFEDILTDNLAQIDSEQEEDWANSILESSFSEAEKYDIEDTCTSMNDILKKIRTIVKYFRNSPKNDEVLQSHMKSEFNKEKKLQLDCPTRWNSMEAMLSSFIDCLTPIKKALIDLSKE